MTVGQKIYKQFHTKYSNTFQPMNGLDWVVGLRPISKLVRPGPIG